MAMSDRGVTLVDIDGQGVLQDRTVTYGDIQPSDIVAVKCRMCDDPHDSIFVGVVQKRSAGSFYLSYLAWISGDSVADGGATIAMSVEGCTFWKLGTCKKVVLG